jgi:hypothetical protein
MGGCGKKKYPKKAVEEPYTTTISKPCCHTITMHGPRSDDIVYHM